eukprot:CAMPEP_0170085786 /NCGR_PEP_ID=MMETSP0019_2-20121128/20584_1 /TAXON_ID=98059 /ORGANISM="Dinobryon sp., Strain UTEXLB2267" /LENGTH=289 /DNA_ID=CAMNT_0010302425 /DNA_START=375 /DNA_END=1240 /DNA_ORIENTATION=+
MKGRIISMANYGLFVDVGSKKDGLVHVKDVSKDYFIPDLKSRFRPGQDVDVWVKFIDVSNYKLGLQMFPPAPGPEESQKAPALDWAELVPQKAVSGTAVKYSDFGVFVDIGLPKVLAFLHKRKMRINRRQRKYQPWEIVPLGSVVAGFVFAADPARERVELTTVPPPLWDQLLPRHTHRPEEDEEMGTGTPTSLDDEEEEGEGEEEGEEGDSEEDEGDEGGELLSEKEIRQIALSRGRTQLLIDDSEQEDGRTEASPVRHQTESGDAGPEEELSAEELFQSLSGGRDWV